jgi:hypothetical protein
MFALTFVSESETFIKLNKAVKAFHITCHLLRISRILRPPLTSIMGKVIVGISVP